jgi:hypothetical protein
MNCICGIQAFFYETIKSDQLKYKIYKCGYVGSECKRGKCDFNIETQLHKITLPIYNSIIDPESQKILKYKPYDYIKELENYIHLYEISKNNYSMSKDNYISNINFILKKLNFPLFFAHRESLHSLKLRIYNVPCKKKIKKSEYPVLILEIPENLKTINKKTSKKVKSFPIKNHVKNNPRTVLLSTDELLENIKKMKIKSDTENGDENGDENDDENEDEHDEDDNSFDVDNYESDIEDTFFDDGGGISD